MIFMSPRVVHVKYQGHYKLMLTFANGEVKQFDFRSYLNYPVYEALQDEIFCKKVKTSDGIVQWNEDIDFSPDTIYLESVSV
jgi:hypothetical protein